MNLGDKHSVYSTYVLSLHLWFSPSWRGYDAVSKQPFVEADGASIGVWPIASKNLGPANSHLKELRSRSFPG